MKKRSRENHPLLTLASQFPPLAGRASFDTALVISGNIVVSSCNVDRSTVLTFEGQKHFIQLLHACLQRAGVDINSFQNLESLAANLCERGAQASTCSENPLPNAQVVVLRAGLPNSVQSLRVITSLQTIQKGEAVKLDIASLFQAFAQEDWYSQCFPEWRKTLNLGSNIKRDARAFFEGNRLPVVDLKSQTVPLLSWPCGAPYYHGLGESAKTLSDHTLYFPYSLLELRNCGMIGKGEMEVIARAPIPAGTCFVYTGSIVDFTRIVQHHSDSTITHDQAVNTSYLFGQKHCIYGHGITRYINHHLHFAACGNVEFFVIPTPLATQSCSENSNPKKKTDCYFNVPVFIATTDIAPGDRVLAQSYGPDYDANLERDVARKGLWLSPAEASSLIRRSELHEKMFAGSSPQQHRCLFAEGSVAILRHFERQSGCSSPCCSLPHELFPIGSAVLSQSVFSFQAKPLLRCCCHIGVVRKCRIPSHLTKESADALLPPFERLLTMEFIDWPSLQSDAMEASSGTGELLEVLDRFLIPLLDVECKPVKWEGCLTESAKSNDQEIFLQRPMTKSKKIPQAKNVNTIKWTVEFRVVEEALKESASVLAQSQTSLPRFQCLWPM